MPLGGFCQAVVVRESSARHCFLSLPRSLAVLVVPSQIPTFTLVATDGTTLMLSWAGEVHGDSVINGETCEEVHVGREVLKGNGVSDGASVVMTQVAVPPQCVSVRVVVGSFDEWEVLALNAEVAQVAFLNQVRVVSLGQCVPLWLEGGACVTLRIIGLEPSKSHLTLHPMSQVEVLPPTEEQAHPHTHTPINFTPIDPSPQSPQDDRLTEHSNKIDERGEHQIGSTTRMTDQTKTNKIEQQTKDTLIQILEFMVEKLNDRTAEYAFPIKKDLRLGLRVVGVPEDVIESIGCLARHPSLVIISQRSLCGMYEDKVTFPAGVHAVKSPKDIAEGQTASREKKDADDKSSKSSRESLSHFTCSVLVWERYVAERSIPEVTKEEINAALKGGNCVIPNVLRRFMKISDLSIIEISTADITTRTAPVCVDILPITNAMSSQVPKLNSNPELKHNIKSLLKTLTDEAPVIINKTLLEVQTNGGLVDVLVTTRDSTPLELTWKSVVLLNVTSLKDPPDLPHILPTTKDLTNTFQPRYPYVGDQDVFMRLMKHCLFALDAWSTVGPQFALLQGSKGSGKTSLLETVMESLQKHPHHVHCSVANLKTLRGKKPETIDKKLQLLFREAMFRRPSVVFLDDLDSLVPSVGLENQMDSGPLHSHSMQMVTVFRLLLDQLMEFLESVEEEGMRGGVLVVASCVTRSSINPLLVSPQGCHYFPCTFSIPPLSPSARVQAFSAMLSTHINRDLNLNASPHTNAQGHEATSQHSTAEQTHRTTHTDMQTMDKQRQQTTYDSTQSTHKQSLSHTRTIDKQTPQTTQNSPQNTRTPPHTPKQPHLSYSTKLLAKRTESFTLPDLNHLSLRTYLNARDRWRHSEKDANEGFQRLPMAVKEYPVEDSHIEEAGCVLDTDVEDALEGYTPLALRGLNLSDKRSKKGVTCGVGGLGEARRVLEETLTWPAIHPALFSKVKLRLRSGVLLYGPPGSGKTLLAHSIASECQLNFIAVKGPELLSKYIGASEEAVRDAFERASSAKPCILFFDEFESIAPRRGHDSTGVTDRVVNQLLTQMDGVEGLSGVYVLAATSRPDLIDPALLRPGRLDKCVLCPIPTHNDRVEILEVLSQNLDLGEEIDWREVADLTEHFTGADLQGVLSSAQVMVGQEVIGDKLYEGILERDDSRQSDVEGDSDFDENEFVEAERDYCNRSEAAGGDSYTIQEVVLEEKEEKVIYKEREVTPLKESRSESPRCRAERNPDSSLNTDVVMREKGESQYKYEGIEASSQSNAKMESTVSHVKNNPNSKRTVRSRDQGVVLEEGEVMHKEAENNTSIDPQVRLNRQTLKTEMNPQLKNQDVAKEKEKGMYNEEEVTISTESNDSKVSHLKFNSPTLKTETNVQSQYQDVLVKEKEKGSYDEKEVYGSPPSSYDERLDSVVPREGKKNLTCGTITNTQSSSSQNTDETTHSTRVKNSVTKNTYSSSRNPDETENLNFKVYRRHILAAVRETKPSVTSAERQKYEHLYRSFGKSREGSFGQPAPGKRATLA